MAKSLHEIKIEQIIFNDMRKPINKEKQMFKCMQDFIKRKEQSLLYAAYGEFMRIKEPSDYEQTISSQEFIVFLRKHENKDYNPLMMTSDEKEIYTTQERIKTLKLLNKLNKN